ncbi:MAG: hypothetical protein BWY76_02397 [bacterium ADurb.Bin429]|nr:MAG: hypothetical protein BWY76_02397 [bacterium ADurb.Bin429]
MGTLSAKEMILGSIIIAVLLLIALIWFIRTGTFDGRVAPDAWLDEQQAPALQDYMKNNEHGDNSHK